MERIIINTGGDEILEGTDWRLRQLPVGGPQTYLEAKERMYWHKEQILRLGGTATSSQLEVPITPDAPL